MDPGSRLRPPEVLGLIGQFLDQHSAVQCILVCKEWHTAFLPFVWQSIHRTTPHSQVALQPEQMSFLGYAHHIRDLILVSGSLPRIWPQPMPTRLKRVFLHVNESYGTSSPTRSIGHRLAANVGIEYNDHSQDAILILREEMVKTQQEALLLLVQKNPSLSDLHLAFLNFMPCSTFWETLAHSASLKSLILEADVLSASARSSFWKLFRNLESVSLRHVCLGSQQIGAAPVVDGMEDIPVENVLREIALDNVTGISNRTLMDLLVRFKKLERLEWKRDYLHSWRMMQRLRLAHLNAENLLADLMTASLTDPGTWMALTALKLESINLSDDQISMILQQERHSTFTEFSIPGNHFAAKSFVALKRHFETLVVLDLSYSGLVTSRMVQRCLTSCPDLRVFAADSLCVDMIMADPMEREPWVCRGLERLSLDLTILPSSVYSAQENDICHEFIFEQLGLLLNLRELDLRRVNKENPHHHFMEDIFGTIDEANIFGQCSHQLYLQQPNAWHFFSSTLSSRKRRLWPVCADRGRGFQAEMNLDDHGIQLRLDKGLGQLRDLTRLEYLAFSERQEMDEEEIRWMKQHWSQLVSCLGPSHVDELVRKSHQEIFPAMKGAQRDQNFIIQGAVQG